MNKLFYKTLAIVSLLVASSFAQAGIMLSFAPSSSNLNVGDSLSINVNISGLTNQGASSLGDYDVDVSYDDNVFSFVNGSFGTGLGPRDPLDEFILYDIDGTTTPGIVDVFEISAEDPADLNTSQPDSFTLFTLNFSAIAMGTFTMSIVDDVDFILSDENANPFAGSIERGTAEITVSAVPVPAAIWLFGSGLIGLMGFRKYKFSE